MIGWDLNATTRVLIKESRRDREEGGHVKVGGRAGGTQAQAKDASSHQRLEEAGRTTHGPAVSTATRHRDF